MNAGRRVAGWSDEQLVVVVEYMQADQALQELLHEQRQLGQEIKRAQQEKTRLWKKFQALYGQKRKS